jgi:hypothetical protein
MLAGQNRDPLPEKTEQTPFAGKAKDLGALRDAVVDAATVGTGLWLSYLFALFYFAIAAGAVTHRVRRAETRSSRARARDAQLPKRRLCDFGAWPVRPDYSRTCPMPHCRH